MTRYCIHTLLKPRESWQTSALQLYSVVVWLRLRTCVQILHYQTHTHTDKFTSSMYSSPAGPGSSYNKCLKSKYLRMNIFCLEKSGTVEDTVLLSLLSLLVVVMVVSSAFSPNKVVCASKEKFNFAIKRREKAWDYIQTSMRVYKRDDNMHRHIYCHVVIHINTE